MTTTRTTDADASGAVVGAATDHEELAALREIVQLGTTAPTWDELMQLIVDRSTVAMGAEVCSLYLVDRDGEGMTLAATNGVDRQHVGVARLAVGQGISGLAAETRAPVLSTDLANDPRCAWIRGVDHERFTSILAVPLIARDRVIGALNVKTEARREFSPAEIRRLSTIASLLAGVVERRRLHLETEAQLDALRSIDQARAELIAVVTHQLRTPLAVVRAYLDLLAESAAADGNAEVRAWHDAATGQVARLDELVSAILDTVRADRLLTVEARPFEVGAVIDEVLTRLAPLLRRHRLERYTDGPREAIGDPARMAQVLELLLDNAGKYAPPGATIVVADWTERGEVHVAVGDDGPGIPPEVRESVFEPFVRLGDTGRPGAGVGLFAARRLAGAMGGRLWIEDKPAGGSQFVTALPGVAGDGS
ncbi:MAG TPA: ATP-binding protein [Candidatus Limnocylindrales bacterium]|nr:ATP-binding protein [Candidatus Limnocylindrales bacterium]